MVRLIKKYSILIVTSIVAIRLLTTIIMTIWPDLLTTRISETETHTLGTGILEQGIEYIFNIVFVFLIKKDMKTENITSVPVLFLTFFSSLLGVIFFLLTTAFYKLNGNPIIQND